jgi:hypothetical protein
MKLAVRALVLGICAMGASAALATSHAAAVSAVPIPTCGPKGCNGTGNTVIAAVPIPTCGPKGCNGTGNTVIAAVPIPTCGPKGCNGTGK